MSYTYTHTYMYTHTLTEGEDGRCRRDEYCLTPSYFKAVSVNFDPWRINHSLAIHIHFFKIFRNKNSIGGGYL